MESDETLYRDMRKGSNAAFDRLYAKYERPLFSFLLKRLGNRQEAEEAFQETMISLYRAPDALEDKGSFQAYIYKVAINLSLNRSRSMKREQVALARVFAFGSEGPKKSEAEEGLIEREAEAMAIQQELRMKEALGELSPPLRQVYELRRDGRSYEEMSDLVGVPIGTIKSRINKMMSELRKGVGKWIAK